jgi:hypothetical protein
VHHDLAAPLSLRVIKALKSNGVDGPLASPSIRAARKAASLVFPLLKQPPTGANHVAGCIVTTLRDLFFDEIAQVVSKAD